MSPAELLHLLDRALAARVEVGRQIRRPAAQSASGGTHKSEQRPFTADLVIENDGDLKSFLGRIDDLAGSLMN